MTYATNPEWLVAHVLVEDNLVGSTDPTAQSDHRSGKGWTLCGRRPGILWRFTRTSPRGSNLCGQCWAAQQHRAIMAEQVVI